MRHYTLLAMALGSILGLTACGNNAQQAQNPNPNDKADTQNTSSASPSVDTTNSDIKGGTLTINNGSEPESLDPHILTSVQGASIARQFAEGLVTTDNDGSLVGGVASEWNSPDNKVWTFKLKDAKWSNGDPVTAHDFVYSFRRLVDPNTASDYASYLEDAKVLNASDIIQGKAKPETLGVKAIDDKTLEVTLSEAVPYFPDMMIHSAVYPVHQKTVEAFGERWTSPENIVVNGPYKPSEWIVNEKIVLEKNPNYHDVANVRLDKLIVLPIPSATTDVQRYQAGDIDITASELPPEQFDHLKQTLGDELKTADTLCTYYYAYNLSKAPFDDVRVRKALSMALDRDTIVDKVMGQGQKIAYQFTPKATKGNIDYTPEWQSWDKERRIQEAKKLLAEAGYNEQNPLKFELLYDTNESHKKIALAAVSLWKDALGFVDVNMLNKEWKTYLESRKNGDYQLARARWCGDYNEASTFLNLYKSTSSNNWGRFHNNDYDSVMLKTLNAGITDADRSNLYVQAESILDKESAQIPIFTYANVRLVKPTVQGYSNKDPLDQWQAKYWSSAR